MNRNCIPANAHNRKWKNIITKAGTHIIYRWLIACTCVLLHLSGQAQKYNDIWTFGNNTGIDFTGSEPYILDTSAIRQEVVLRKLTYAASICNKYGDLLMYTDGYQVWQRHHQEIPKYLGRWPWTEHIIPLFCPYPGNDSMYYLFGVSDGSYAHQLQYLSIKAKINGSMPEIIYPMPSTYSNYYTVLKTDASLFVAGTLHCNRRDYWITTHSKDAFYSYLVTDKGVSTTPVVSPIPASIMQAGLYDDINIRFSANSEKLLVTLTKQRKVIVFDFNNLTGNFSNPIVIAMKNEDQVADAELSPDGSKLYIAWHMPFPVYGGDIYNIAQYDLQAGTQQDIINSFYGVVKDSARTNFCGGKICFAIKRTMELGPDGNIYASEEYKVFPTLPTQPQTYFIGRISNTNEKGPKVKYRYNALKTDVKNPLYLKYNYIRSSAFSVRENGILYDKTVCNSSPVKFSLLYTKVDSVKWDFGDSLSGASNFSRAFSPEHVFSAPGDYTTRAIMYTRCFVDTAYTNVEVSDKPAIVIPESIKDSTLCVGESLQVNATVPSATDYIWSTGSKEPSIELKKAGTYWVKVSNECQSSTKTFSIFTDSCNCKVFVPNAFTPNMDQLNDIFRPILDCNGLSGSGQYQFKIFNRYGAVVFASTKPGEGWNGKLHNEPVETGTYKWILQYTDPNNQKPIRQSGSVTLLR